MANQEVYEFITTESNAYKTRGIPLADNYEWSMFEHIKRSFLYKNSKFFKGENDGLRPFKNIILPILDVAYRSEGFDVKDIVPFVNEAKNYYKSFLVKKYHPKWARANDIDNFIDEMVESYTDFGLALIKNVNNVRPETVPLQRLAFCDQTSILSGPICELHQFSPDQLYDMAGKWDADVIDELIEYAKSGKTVIQAEGQEAKTPGKYIEIFELHGVLPKAWLAPEAENENEEPQEVEAGYVQQIQVCSYYVSEDGKKQGVTLYKGKEKPGIYKAIVRKPIFGRACGLGGIEELFEPQTWVNMSEIQQAEMLEVASMMIVQTSDKEAADQTNLTEMEKGEILTHAKGEPFSQLSLTPQNKVHFDNSVAEWERNARQLGSADDALLGTAPAAGTPFKLQALVVQEGKGAHDYRRGKVATFMGDLYRDWILKYLVNEMDNGQTFNEELTLEELQQVADQVITNAVNAKIIEGMMKPGFDAVVMPADQRDALVVEKKGLFMKGGNKRFLEILKGELGKLPVDVEMNIAGKQDYLADRADKLTNIFRSIISNPQVLQAPGMAKLFNDIIESSGLNPIDFTSFTTAPAAPVAPPAPEASAVAPVAPSPVLPVNA